MTSTTARFARPAHRCPKDVLAAAGVAVLTLGALPTAHAQSYTYKTIASFNGTNGQVVADSLVLDSSSNLYSTAEEGGANGDGTIVKIAAGTNTITTIASFNGGNGEGPLALYRDTNGDLFGTTNVGGPDDEGTVFEIQAGTSNIQTLVSFVGPNGAYPYIDLLPDAHGDLFGVTDGGGSTGLGTVFEIAAGTNTASTIGQYSVASGLNPGRLVMDGSGNLYGYTTSESTNNDGTVYKLENSGTVANPVYSGGVDVIATLTESGQFASGLTVDAAGDLFLTASQGGGSNDGTLLEIAAGSTTVQTLASFQGSGITGPGGNLLMDSQGNLYGAALTGGLNGSGAVYEYNAGSRTLTSIASLPANSVGTTSTAGAWLSLMSNGDFFGSTEYGGTNGYGSIFEITPTGASAATPEPESGTLVVAIASIVGAGFAQRGRRPGCNSVAASVRFELI